jgi:hypothetical protein
MALRRIIIMSSLTRQECVRRLQESVDRDSVLSGNKPVIGRVRETSLRLRKRIKGRNSFQTVVFAKIVQDQGRTRLECRFGIHPIVIGFMLFWFGGVITLGSRAIAGAPGVLDSIMADPMLILGPLVMIMGGIAVLVICRNSARDEQQFLTDFLLKTIDGRVQTPSVVSPHGG